MSLTVNYLLHKDTLVSEAEELSLTHCIKWNQHTFLPQLTISSRRARANSAQLSPGLKGEYGLLSGTSVVKNQNSVTKLKYHYRYFINFKHQLSRHIKII